MYKGIVDKVKFIFHEIITGIIFWMVTAFYNSYQKLVIKNIRHRLLGMFLIMSVFVVFIYYYNISVKKSTWKPLGGHSDIVGAIIIILVYIMSFCILGYPEITF